MKKFTNAWLWMMLLIISSQIDLQAQKFASSDRAPGKIDTNEELLKQLSGIKFSEEQIIVLEKHGMDIKSIIDDECLLKAAEVLGLAKKTNNEDKAGNYPGLFLAGKTSQSKAILDFPWIEGFEDVTIPALPPDWLEENGDWVTTNNASSTYDADAHTGTQFLRESYYATNEYVWTPGFALDAGTPYDLSFWWAGDNFSGWTGDIFYNTTQNSAGATQLGTSFVEAGTTTTKNYAQVLYTFLPTTTSTYYFAIRVNCPSYTPWYLSFDDFRLEPSPPCPNPSSLGATNITSSTADLVWTSLSGLSDIEFGPYGFTPTGIPTNSAIISPFNIGGLLPSTWYSFYVRDDCGGGLYSNWAGPFSFSTTQILATLPYFIDFESGNMNDWTVLNGTQVNTWYVGTATAYPGSSYSVYISNDNGISNNYTIGTSSVVHFYRDIEFPNVPNPINLTFDWKCFGESTYDYLKVFLIEPNIIPVPGSQLTTGLIGNTYYNLQSDWQSASIQLDPGVNGTIKRLVFSWRNDASIGTPPPAAVDNINLYVITCPQPIDLGATYIAATSADLTWSSYSGLSDIEFGLEGFTPTGVPTYAGVVSPYSVTGLTAVTGYSFYVRDDCGGGDYSPWSGPYTFTTQPTCPQPFDLGATNITMTTADLLWISFSGLSDIEFGPSGFTPTGIPTYAGVTSPYSLSGLNSASPYDFYVRDDCGGGDYSFWSGPYTFLTMPGTQTMPVFEDFENGFVYFNNASGNGSDWSINNTYYHSGGQCGHNSYDNSQTNILHETGIIDLSAAEVVWLDFWQIAKTEGNYDHCIVEISTDGGLNYTPLPVETYTGSGNYYVPTANPPYEICFDEDSYAIWGTGTEIPDNSTWWQHETFDLSNYLTTNVRIRFRLHTDASLIRYGWLLDEILIFEPAYGTLTGTVTEAASNNPVEGATINIGSLTTTSAIDGTYNFPAVLTGTWMVNCSKTGFNPANTAVTILEDQTTTQDFSLTAPQIVLNTTSIAVEIEPNATADELINISNTGNGELNWNADVSILGDNSDDIGDILLELDVTAAATETQMLGGEWDGTYFWTTGGNSGADPNKLYKFDINGTLISTYDQPAASTGWGIRDLAWDGTYLYGGNESQFYQIDPNDGTFTLLFNQSFSIIRALAWVPSENAFYTKDFGNALYKFDIGGNVLETIDVPEAAAVYGAAWDNINNKLWLFDQSGPSATHATTFVEFDISTNTVTGTTYLIPLLTGSTEQIAGGAFFATDLISGKAVLGGVTQGTPDDIIFAMELGDAFSWITINPLSGTLAPSTNEDIAVHFDATELLPGVYQAEIHFSTNPDVGSPVVNVTMTVEGLIPAVNLTAGHSCTDVELTWEMPIGGNPDSWNVYKDGTLQGNVTSMEHTDPMVTTGVEISYYVTAVYAGEESMPSTPATITVPIPGSLQPIGLSAEANTPNYGYVTLEWNQPNACLDPDGYDVYRDNVKVNTALVTELTYIEGPLPSGLYEYKLKAVYYFGESGFSTPAYAFIPVGIEDAEESNFRIYPNPASQLINIESGIEITGIKILNNSGQKLFDETLNIFNYQIDVSRFEKGIYYIGIKTKDSEVYKKITID